MTEEKTKTDEEIWEEVNPIMADMWDTKKDKTIQGIYIRKDEKVGPNESNIYILQVDEEEIGVWGSTLLDSRFRAIEIGMEVRIEYLGMEKSEKSGREYHNFKVSKRPSPFQPVKDEKGNGEIPVVDADA